MLNETDLSRVDLNLLVLFEVVLEERHVGRAAERVNLSASAVSHGLGRLRRLLNDPLFLRTPKGVVPTARATELAEPIADILARAKRVIASAEPFDPARSVRRFTIGAPDGVSAVFMRPLLAGLQSLAPGIDVSVRQLLPPHGGRQIGRAWEPALSDLEARTIDIAVAPLDDIPARFVDQILYEEDFVIAMRAGHPFTGAPTLDRYCGMRHLVVSLTGDAYGFVDEALAEQGRSRRIALTVPNFMMALAVIAETDLITALPRRFVAMHAERFGVVSTEAPLRLPRFRIRAIASKAAMMDAGLVWLFETMRKGVEVKRTARRKRRSN
jgi:DNA-binding transcriptional LysR family regulator